MGYVGKHRGARQKRRVVRTVSLSVAVVLVALATCGYLVYRRLEGNISVIDIDGQLTDRPSEVAANKEHKPLNVLVLGSDSRAGQTSVLGQTPGLSDTTILLHLSADRSRAYGVSVPRDLMVDRPECQRHDGSTISAGLDMWNAAYAYGGAVCTVKQFEEMTDIRVNHTVVVDFNGFKAMVDALGGVPICVPKEVNDTVGRIHLPAGSYEVNGAQALDYVRVRHVLSANGDIGRMRRQQAFLASMVNKAVSVGTLANPVKLYSFLDAATKSLTTDEGLSKLNRLADLANQLRDLGLDRIQFMTMPIQAYQPDPNRLAPGEGADAFWERIRLDKALTKAQREGATSAAAAGSGASPSSSPNGSPSGSPNGSTGASPSGSPTASPSGSATPDAARVADAEANGLCA